MENENIEEETLDPKEIVKDLETFLSERSSYYKRDATDTSTARSFSSGFAFTEEDRNYRGTIKPEVYMNVIMSWRDQLVAMYNADPFHIGLKTARKDPMTQVMRVALDDIQESSKLTTLIPDLFKKVVDEGFAYGILYTEEVDSTTKQQDLKFRTIDIRKVMVDACEDPTLADVSKLVVFDVLSKAEVKAKYEKAAELMEYASSTDLFVPDNIDFDSKNQCIIYTFYEKVEDGIKISKVLYKDVLDSTVVPLSRIPVFRFYGESVYIEDRIHYRGIYHFVMDLLKLLNYTASELQHQIATTPSTRWMGDAKALANHAETFTTNTDSAVAEYDSHDGDKELKAPVLLDTDLKAAGYLSTINGFMTIIKEILGNPAGDSKSNETAEAVLTRKNIAKATSNKFINAFKNTLTEIGKVVIEYVGLIYDIPRQLPNGMVLPIISDVNGMFAEVVNGPIEADKQREILEKLLAFNQIVIGNSANPEAAKMLPFLVKYLPIPEQDKQQLFGMFGGNTNPMAMQLQQTTQANQQLTVQSQQQAQQIALLNQRMQEANQYIQQLTNVITANESKVRSDILQTQIKVQSDKEIAIIKEKGANDRKQAEIEAKTTQEVIKAQNKLEESLNAPMGDEAYVKPAYNLGNVL